MKIDDKTIADGIVAAVGERRQYQGRGSLFDQAAFDAS